MSDFRTSDFGLVYLRCELFASVIDAEYVVDLDRLGIPLVVALVAVFLVWYFVGSVLNRRRMAEAARWVNRGLEGYRDEPPNQSKASIKWLSTNAFNILLEGARPPFQGIIATVLLQSRDMITVWFMDRLTGRRDLLMLRCDLRRQPIWGLEVFRPRSILAGDARRLATGEGWPIQPSEDKSLMAAHGGGKAGELCSALLDALGEERWRLIRLGIRRRAPHLTLALDLPDPASTDPHETMRLAERLATITLGYSTF